MKICLVIHALYGGGAERLMSRLAKRWSRDHEVHLVTWAPVDSDKYAVPTTVVRHGLNVLRPSRNAIHGIWANWQRVRRLRGMLLEVQPDIVVSFTDQVNIVALQAARRLSLPVWIAEHSDPRHQRLSSGWERWRDRVYGGAAGCVVLTQEIARYAERWFPPGKIRVIPAAVDDIPMGMRTSVESHRRQVVYVGRLSAEKRLDRLIDAWRIVADSLDDWQLVIVGDGPERSSLEQRARGVPRVTFTGWKDDPTEIYRQGGVFVLTSQYEGFPVSLLEAMLHGMPCIATRCTAAVDELNIHGQALEIVPQDVTALSQSIAAVAVDPELRAILSDRGAAAASRYQWSQVGPLWDRVLER